MTRLLFRLSVLLVLIGGQPGLALAQAESRGPGRLQYNRDIRPILSNACFSCHGPDASQRKAKLRLDVRENALSQKAIVPGKVGESEMIARIRSDDPDEVMPPPNAHKSLTASQKATLERWVSEGAEYQAHWSYISPTKPNPPKIDAKISQNVRNPIDAFILDRLAREALTPSPEASRETLIRRVSLDLVGLPPTPAEIDAFLADKSPDAFERVVDRLLASPRFGERMAIDWLDAARFADSNGYQVDRDRELWPWRDWVIQAFNKNLPFDTFTIEQLAGDLLPNATIDQKIATGFHRNHMLNEEGGIIPEEFLAEYTADRVETTAAVWLGQTFNCARCHDHKYDPFTQRDFYALKAFFHNVPEKGIGDYGAPIRVNAPPFLRIPSPEIEARIAELKARMDRANRSIDPIAKQANTSLNAWTRRIVNTPITWWSLPILADATKSTSHVIGAPKTPGVWKFRVRVPSDKLSAIRIVYKGQSARASLELSEVRATVNSNPVPFRAGTSIESIERSESGKLIDKNKKTRVDLNIKSPSIVFELDPLPALTSEIAFELDIERVNGSIGLQVFVNGDDPELLVSREIQAIARKPARQRTAAETERLRVAHLERIPEHMRLVAEVAAVKQAIQAAEAEIPTTLVMAEQPTPRPTFVLMRGAYDKPGAQVQAATPGILPSIDPKLPRNRLGLAKWLVSPDNPLTARVAVNRFWQQIFGTGLVRTTEDFGSQGEPPSHPELLDWLGVHFRESGWNIKGLLRLIVTSATYRQRSNLSPLLRERDPENRLLARGPRFRLPAELVRDQALAVSGLLVQRIGGPSVRPYHPPGLYEQVTAGNGYNVYVADKGEKLYRRSLYTYWKRSVPHPAMLIFDAPFRETCTLRRPRSNTPLQALNLLNDPTYVEASKFLAVRMQQEGGPSVESRLEHGFRIVLGRRPTPRELDILQRAYERSRSDFQADPDAAKALLSVGEKRFEGLNNTAELAALATIADTLLNLDETVTKE